MTTRCLTPSRESSSISRLVRKLEEDPNLEQIVHYFTSTAMLLDNTQPVVRSLQFVNACKIDAVGDLGRLNIHCIHGTCTVYTKHLFYMRDICTVYRMSDAYTACICGVHVVFSRIFSYIRCISYNLHDSTEKGRARIRSYV